MILLQKPEIRFQKREGFTLIELSIALVIIGLLVGGTLVGKEMIHSSKLVKLISEKQQFQMAINNFRTQYDAYPGDFSNAKAFFPSCTDAGSGNNNCNGNGNRLIGELSAPHLAEPCRFWEHLSLAGLIPDVELTFNNLLANICLSTSVPRSRALGQLTWNIGKSYGPGGDVIFPWTNQIKNYFVLNWERVSHWGANMVASGVANLAPTDAEYIDRKIDDGMPLLGKVVAANTITGWNGSTWAGGELGAYTAPNAADNLYCIYSATPVVSPVDPSTWTYYPGYTQSINGCMLAIELE